MFNSKKLEEIAKQISESVPPGVKHMADEIESKTKQILQRKLSQMDFVSREEFDVQTQVLLRTREKLTALEEKISQIEASLAGTDSDDSDQSTPEKPPAES